MRAFGWVFGVLGLMGLVGAVGFGAWWHWFSMGVCVVMARCCWSERRKEGTKKG